MYGHSQRPLPGDNQRKQRGRKQFLAEEKNQETFVFATFENREWASYAAPSQAPPGST
jgi:hypothetical protein